DARHVGLPAEPAFGTDFAGDARHLAGEAVELVHHRVERLLQLKDFAAHIDGDLAREVAVGDGGGHFGDVANLAGEIAAHQFDAVGEVLPGAGHAGHLRLAAELALGADFARHARHFAGERVELVHHGVERFLELKDFTAHIHRDLLRQVALRDGGGDFRDVADLASQIARHRVDAVGQVLPGAGHAAHQRLAAELAFGADFARHARDFAGEGIELVHHGVDGVLQFQNFAAHVDGDLLGEIAAGHRRRHLGDVADLRGQVRRHRVDAVGRALPRAGHARPMRLPSELAFGADFARDARYFRGETIELVHHRVDGVLELQDFAAHVDGDLARQVAARHGGRHLGDVAHLVSQVAAHRVHRVGQILPGAGDTGNDCLASKLAVGADLARDACHFGGEHVELLDHRVDDRRRLQELAAQRTTVDVETHGLQEVSLRDGGNRAGHFGRGPNEVVDEGIDGVFHLA